MSSLDETENIRHLFYGISVNDSYKSGYKDLKRLISSLCSGESYLYIFDEQKNYYQAVTDDVYHSKKIQPYPEVYSFIEKVMRHPYLEDIVYKRMDQLAVIVLPLNPTNHLHGLMILIDDNVHQPHMKNNEFCHQIKKESEYYLNILHHHQSLVDKYRKKEMLLELTTNFYAMETKEDILKQILVAVKRIFPEASYSLLLSQDHDLDEILPVKTFDYSSDILTDESYLAFISGQLQIKISRGQTHLYAPLVGKQGIYGVLQILSAHPIVLSNLDKEFIKQFSSISGRAIERMIMYEDSKGLVADLQMINQTSHEINSHQQQDQILQLVKTKIRTTSNASEIGFIFSSGHSDNKLRVLAGSTSFFKTVEGTACSAEWLKKIKKTREPIITGKHKVSRFHSMIMIPMEHAEKVVGAVIMMHEDEDYFTFDRFKFLQTLIQHSTIALMNTMLREKLEDALSKDYLTNLQSRHYLEQRIHDHIKTERQGVLILFDIDDFKQINDQFGHHVGDNVIIQVANVLKFNIGTSDVAARWGGEELAIYLPNCSLNAGYRLAKTIGQQVKKETNPEITISAGVAAWCKERKPSVKSLFIQADHALYEAKKIGKDCVIKK